MRARVLRTLLVWLLPILAALGPATAQADPLMLTTSHPGDVTTFFTAVNYVPGTLTAIGVPISLDSTYSISSGLFNLTASIDPATGTLLGGSLEIDGTISANPPNYSSPLLTGTLTEFGYPSLTNFGDGSPFEFVFNVTGGSLAPLYSSGEGGIIMDIANGSGSASFNSTQLFTAPFSNDGISGFSDTFPLPGVPFFTPEPSSWVLMGVGLTSLMSLMWRRHGRAARLI